MEVVHDVQIGRTTAGQLEKVVHRTEPVDQDRSSESRSTVRDEGHERRKRKQSILQEAGCSADGEVQVGCP